MSGWDWEVPLTDRTDGGGGRRKEEEGGGRLWAGGKKSLGEGREKAIMPRRCASSSSRLPSLLLPSVPPSAQATSAMLTSPRLLPSRHVLSPAPPPLPAPSLFACFRLPDFGTHD